MTREVPKLPYAVLEHKLKTAMQILRVGTRLRHKSGYYEVVGHSIDCKSNEVYIQYKPVPKSWDEEIPDILSFTRPYADFVEPRFKIVRRQEVWLSDQEYKEYKLMRENGA